MITKQIRDALESLDSQLSNAHHVCHLALLVFLLCQIIYNFKFWVSELDAKNPILTKKNNIILSSQAESKHC